MFPGIITDDLKIISRQCLWIRFLKSSFSNCRWKLSQGDAISTPNQQHQSIEGLLNCRVIDRIKLKNWNKIQCRKRSQFIQTTKKPAHAWVSFSRATRSQSSTKSAEQLFNCNNADRGNAVVNLLLISMYWSFCTESWWWRLALAMCLSQSTKLHRAHGIDMQFLDQT